jgi:hypothetical protein
MSDINWLQKQEHFDWMQKCLTCWKLCEEFISWSIQNGKYINSINVCRDTSEMCSQCIKFEAQRSPFFKNLCEVCAEICQNCVNELRKFEDEAKIFSDTIMACEIFATSCFEVAQKEKENQVNLQG